MGTVLCSKLGFFYPSGYLRENVKVRTDAVRNIGDRLNMMQFST